MTTTGQKILACRPGSAQADEITGVAVGIDEAGRPVVAQSGLAALPIPQRLTLAHKLADLVGEILSTCPDSLQ